MSIRPECYFCEKELTAFGGLLFSPPKKTGEVHTYHLCVACYKRIIKILKLSVKEIEDILSIGPSWLNYTKRVKRVLEKKKDK